MTLCPIALAVGCEKCPAFKICPLPTVLGDVPKAVEVPPGKAKPGGVAVSGVRGSSPRRSRRV